MRHVDGLRSGVALQAELALLASFQQVEVDRAVRRVADSASFHQHSSVLICKWPFLFRVAGGAYFGPDAPQVPSRQRAVSIVAIGALDQALIDPMPDWKLKLRLDIPVAGITELRLFLAQQPGGSLGGGPAAADRNGNRRQQQGRRQAEMRRASVGRISFSILIPFTASLPTGPPYSPFDTLIPAARSSNQDHRAWTVVTAKSAPSS